MCDIGGRLRVKDRFCLGQRIVFVFSITIELSTVFARAGARFFIEVSVGRSGCGLQGSRCWLGQWLAFLRVELGIL